nr:MAG TPA: hypothetical protein [Caudoviricetes sp.]
MKKNEIIVAKLEIVLANLKGQDTKELEKKLYELSKVDIFKITPKEIREITKAVKVSDKIVESIEKFLKA